MFALKQLPVGSRPIALFLVIAASLCLWRGVSEPLAEFTKLFFFTTEPSLIQIVDSLWQSDDWWLAIVVGVFSIALPAAKIGLIALAAIGAASRQWLKPLSALGRWAMLDVLLVAVVIFAAKTSGLATAVTQPGVWWFAGAVLLSAAASAIVKRLP